MSNLVDTLASRKAVMIGLVAGAALVIVLAGASVAAFLQDESADTQEALDELAAYHAEANTRLVAEAAYKQALARAGGAPGLLHAGNTALAEAQLESQFKTIVTTAGADVKSAQILPAAKASGFEVIAVQFDMTVPASRLRDLTYAVETHSPYLFVDDVTLSAPNWQASDAKASDPSLDLRWTVRGYRWSGGS
jgi:general secretion pathway protein M